MESTLVQSILANSPITNVATATNRKMMIANSLFIQLTMSHPMPLMNGKEKPLAAKDKDGNASRRMAANVALQLISCLFLISSWGVDMRLHHRL